MMAKSLMCTLFRRQEIPFLDEKVLNSPMKSLVLMRKPHI